MGFKFKQKQRGGLCPPRCFLSLHAVFATRPGKGRHHRLAVTNGRTRVLIRVFMAYNLDGAHPSYMGANRTIIIRRSGSWRREVSRAPGWHGIARPPKESPGAADRRSPGRRSLWCCVFSFQGA